MPEAMAHLAPTTISTAGTIGAARLSELAGHGQESLRAGAGGALNAASAATQAGVNGSVRYSLPRSVRSPALAPSRLVKWASLAQRPVNQA